VSTLQELARSWQLSMRAERKAARTVTLYVATLRMFGNWLAERDDRTEFDVTEITRDDCREYLAYLVETRSAATGRTRYGALRQFFSWCVDEEELDTSPMATVKPPSVPEHPIQVLGVAQMRDLLAACAGKDFTARRDTAILRLLIDTGMRVSELAGLQVADIDFGGVGDQAGGIAFVLGKGSRHRAAPFGDRTAQSLDRYLRERSRHARARLPALFLGQRGALTVEGVQGVVRRRGQQVGLNGLHPHAFRHSFADWWLRAGGTEGDLMRICGWRSRAMLDRYGASAASSRAREAHQRMGLGDRL
jgi:site-specific recombinase XerD